MKNEYQNYTRLIEGVAWKAAKSFGMTSSIEDIIQEAHIAALESLDRYDEKKAKLSTFLTTSVWLSLLSFYGRQDKISLLPENFEIGVADSTFEYPVWFLDSLNKQEKQMVTYAVTYGEKKTKLKKTFAKMWGWGETLRTFDSIQQKLTCAI